MLVIDTEASFMPHLFDILVVEYHVDGVVVVVVVEVEIFYLVCHFYLVVQAGLLGCQG